MANTLPLVDNVKGWFKLHVEPKIASFFNIDDEVTDARELYTRYR